MKFDLRGQTVAGFLWMETAYDGPSECMIQLKVDPRLDRVRSDPRYQSLLRRVVWLIIEPEMNAPSTTTQRTFLPSCVRESIRGAHFRPRLQLIPGNIAELAVACQRRRQPWLLRTTR